MGKQEDGTGNGRQCLSGPEQLDAVRADGGHKEVMGAREGNQR